MSQLPPVPEGLRALARKQLADPPSGRAKSLTLHIRTMAEYAKRIQWVIIQRTKPPGTIEGVDGGWANQSDWQLLLGQWDQAVTALRTAWQQVKDTNPVVREILATWRERHNVDKGILFQLYDAQDNILINDVWLLLLPEVQDAWGTLPGQVEEALALWSAALVRYFHLLNTSKYVAGPMTKAGLLDDCRKLQQTNRLDGLGRAA